MDLKISRVLNNICKQHTPNPATDPEFPLPSNHSNCLSSNMPVGSCLESRPVSWGHCHYRPHHWSSLFS